MKDEFNILAKLASKYCVGMEGNISQKLGENFIIKASGSKLSNLTSRDIITFDFNGKQLDNLDKKGSMEKEFHRILLSYDGINFVSHTHPVNTLSILCSTSCKKFANKRLFPDQVIFNERKSLLIDYYKPGLDLAKEIKNKLDKFIHKNGYFPKLILLKNHGIITMGKNIDDCIIPTEICEKAAEIFLKNNKKLVFLKDGEIKDLIDDKNEKYRLSLTK